MASTDARENRKRKRNTSSHQRHAKKIKSEKTDHSQLRRRSNDNAISQRFGIPTRENNGSNGSKKPVLEPSIANSNKTSKAKKRRERMKRGEQTTPDAQNDSTNQNRKKQDKKLEAADKLTLTTQSAFKLLRSDGAVEVNSKGVESRKGPVWDISSPSGGRFLNMDPLFSKDEKCVWPCFGWVREAYNLQISSSCYRKSAQSLFDRDLVADSNLYRFSI